MKDLILKILSSEAFPTKLVLVTITAVALLSGSLLLIPDSWIKELMLESFMKDYGQFVGIALVACIALIGALLIVGGSTGMWNRVQLIKEDRTKRTETLAKLENLDNHEKAVLREFYIQEKNTIEVPLDHVVLGMLQKGIICLVRGEQSTFEIDAWQPIILSSGVSDLITLGMMGIPEGRLTGEQMAEIEQSRPGSMKSDGRLKFPRVFG